MAEDLMTLRQIKYNTDTKRFLKEASALIELVNLVNNYQLRNSKLSESCICKVIEPNETNCRSKSRADDGGHLTGQGKTSKPHTPKIRNSAAIRRKTKSIESNPKIIELKRIPRGHLEILKPKIDKEIKLEILKPKDKKEVTDISRDATKQSRKRQRPKKSKNASARTIEREVRRRMLSSNLDMTKVGIQSLKDSLDLNEKKKRRKPIILLSAADSSKKRLKARKCDFSDSILLHKKTTKRSTKKLNNTDRNSRRTVTKKPSLHLMLNLHLNQSSNTLKMQIQSTSKTPKSCKSSERHVVSIRLPCKGESTTQQERIKKLLKNKHPRKLSTSSTKRRASSIGQSPKDRMTKQNQIRYSKVYMPYHKTQVVYNVYDVVPYQQPRQVQGIKSHVSFNLNFGNPPPAEQPAYTDAMSSINMQNGTYVGKPCQVRYKNKVNYNSGLTSLCQSLSLGRRNPQSELSQSYYYPSDIPTEPCDCEPMECVDGVPDDQHTCDTCCQIPIPDPEQQLQQHQQQPIDILENCLTIFKRTKRRIVERVTNVSREASSIVLSPRAFMRRVYDKYSEINNRVEQRLKDQSSCTCSPFIDTDQVSIYEDNVEPECSFLKRCFGSLIYNDKCIVCSVEKGVGTKGLKSYECAPGVCKEAGGIFTCMTKCCRKYAAKKMKECKEARAAKRKLNEKLKKEKAKAKAKAKAQAKKQKEKEAKRKAREKAKKYKKGTPVCRFLLSIFKKKDDQRNLLKKGKYGRKHGDVDGEGRGASGLERTARRGLRIGRRQFRRATKRIRDRYYRNKKLAEEQKGRYACDFYLMSLRNRPCLWVYYMCPFCYPHCLQALNLWRQVSDLLLFFVAILVWSPCILAAELLKVMACNMCV